MLAGGAAEHRDQVGSSDEGYGTSTCGSVFQHQSSVILFHLQVRLRDRKARLRGRAFHTEASQVEALQGACLENWRACCLSVLPLLLHKYHALRN